MKDQFVIAYLADLSMTNQVVSHACFLARMLNKGLILLYVEDSHLHTPAVDQATLELAIAQAGQAVVKVYDLTGKVVYTENLGRLSEGIHTHAISCQNLQHGMYLVNVIVGGQTATSKLVVR